MSNASSGPFAEWSRQQAVALAWPPADSDWRDNLDAIRSCYLTIIGAISQQQALWLVVRPEEAAQLETALQQAGIDRRRISLLPAAFDDTWLRDTLPISLHDADQGMIHCNFAFDGWGGKYPAQQDNQLGQVVLDHLKNHCPRPQINHNLVAEGGAIESDGFGRVFTTRRWLNARYGNEHQSQLEQLRQALCAQQMIVIEHGWLSGDDTDGHVDNLVRLVARNSIVYQGCRPEQDTAGVELQAMAEQLAELRTVDDQPYRLFELPWPGCINDGKRQLPASYANFLLINDAVLLPQFGVESDEQAIRVLSEACPQRRIIGIDANELIRQNGGIHCASMQFPTG